MKNWKLFSVAAFIVLFGIAAGFTSCGDDPGDTHIHQWGEWSVTTPATCTAAGEEARVCSLDPSHNETRSIAALGHDYQWKVTALAAFSEDGEEKEICAHDETHTRETRPIPSVQSAINALEGGTNSDAPASLAIKIDLGDMSHADSGWQKLLTAIAETGKYINLDLSGCKMDGAEFDPVSSIITGKDKIVSLILPDTAQGIAAGTLQNPTFKNFIALRSVSGTGVETVGDYAFLNCTALESISLPLVETIGDYAFNSCTALKSISLSLATSIGDLAFVGTALESVSFPAATNLGIYNPFASCTSLTSITLSGSGSLSVIENGKALVQDGTKLIAYPSASGTVTLNTITSIGDIAFYCCTALESVSLPLATSIGDGAFYGCTALESVTLGASAPTLGDNPLFYVETPTPRTITIYVPSGATGYDEAWQTKFLENNSRITLAVVEQ